MSHKHGAYLGSVRTIDDVRARCVVDGDDGCWHLRMPLSGRAPRRGPTQRLFVYGRGGVSATKAVWELARGRPLPSGRRAVRVCDSYDCLNPQHIRAMQYSDAMRHITGKVGDMTPARRMQLRGLQMRQRKFSAQQAAEILRSSEPVPALAQRYGVSKSTIYALRAGRTYRDAGAGPASVWELAA